MLTHDNQPDSWATTWNASNRPVTWDLSSEVIYKDDDYQYFLDCENKTAAINKYLGNYDLISLPKKVIVNGEKFTVNSIMDNAFILDEEKAIIIIDSNIINVSDAAFSFDNGAIYINYEAQPSTWSDTWLNGIAQIYCNVNSSDIVEIENVIYLFAK